MRPEPVDRLRRRLHAVPVLGTALRGASRQVKRLGRPLQKWRCERDLRAAVPERTGIVIAGMATMPSRLATFRDSFASLVRQVDHLYVYLDGFDRVPGFLRDRADVTVIRSQDEPGLHANGKLLGLVRHDGDFAYLTADDDLHYRAGFVAGLLAALRRLPGPAVVGIHGWLLTRPDADAVQLGDYGTALREDRTVEMLGTGAVMFDRGAVEIDLDAWPKASMTDRGVALAAARAGVPMISIARRRALTIALRTDQADSLSRARSGDGAQSELQRGLNAQIIALHEARTA